MFLCSPQFTGLLGKKTGLHLYPDYGLRGGGMHVCITRGKLNPHLDYSIHPKTGLQRRLNLIVYLSEELRPEHGGHLGLWRGDADGPGELVREVFPAFNTAVVFDVGRHSWHGMSREVNAPLGVWRKSLAMYYLQTPDASADYSRQRALFAPTEEQKQNADVLEFVSKRSKL